MGNVIPFSIFVDENETVDLAFPSASPLHGYALRVRAELAHGDQVEIDSSAVVGRQGEDDRAEKVNEYTLDARKHDRLLMRHWIVAWTLPDDRDERRARATGADPASEAPRFRTVNNAMIDRLTHRAAKEIKKLLEEHIARVNGEAADDIDPLLADS